MRMVIRKCFSGRLNRMLLAGAAWLAMMILCVNAFAAGEKYQNPETGYCVYVQDDASCLEEGEEERLTEQMKEITKYGGAAFVTCFGPGSTSDYARECYRNYFGKDSGALFMIDMHNRQIWIFCDGRIYRTITKPKANQIADNVYRYAKDERYGECAVEVFSQIGTLLEGGRVSERMKHIMNLLLAATGALMIGYLLVSFSSMGSRPSHEELLAASAGTLAFTAASPVLRRTTRKYSPPSDSGSSGGGGGGGGFGGGSSGGGGGHGF